MPDAAAMTNGTDKSDEVESLLAELEAEIENVNAGLARLRGAVARVTYAYTASRTLRETAPAVTAESPPPAWSTDTLPGGEAMVQDDAGDGAEPEASEADGHRAVFGAPAGPGFWDSVAEGASWPRANLADAPAQASPPAELEDAVSMPAEEPPASEPTWAFAPMAGGWGAEAGAEEAGGPEAGPAGNGSPAPDEPAERGAPVDQWAIESAPANVFGEGATSAEAEGVEPAVTDEWAIIPAASDPWAVEPADQGVSEPEAGPADGGAEEQPAADPWAWNPADEQAASLASPSVFAQAEAAQDAHGPLRRTEEQEQPQEQEQPEQPAPRITGWLDESVWATNWAWPARSAPADSQPAEQVAADLPHSTAPGAEQGEGDPAETDIRAIIARVRAELDAAEQAGVDLRSSLDAEDAWAPAAPEDDAVTEPAMDVAGGGSPADGNGFWNGAEPETVDDVAKREEVSRAVEEIRRQIEMGGLEAVLRQEGIETEVPGEDGPGDAGPPADVNGFWNGAEPEVVDDAAKREQVSRAVEEIRRQIEMGGLEAVLRQEGIETEVPGSDGPRDAAPAADATADEGRRPAFRLAAPGSIPDWSQFKAEPSGPPIVVIKDQDGRVELASVFETLNQLGCGDGASLLNYTPHSVTVGLPLLAKFPSTEEMARVVETVFGIRSRVESDGVRITVSIGEDPKQRSVGAA